MTSFLDLSGAAWRGCTGSGADERGTHVGNIEPRWLGWAWPGTGATHTHTGSRTHTLTGTYTPELAQPYVYIWRYTHTPPAPHWLARPPSLINIKQPGQAAIGGGIWEPPGSWGRGLALGGAGSGGAGTSVLHAYFISKKWRAGEGVGLGLEPGQDHR